MQKQKHLIIMDYIHIHDDLYKWFIKFLWQKSYNYNLNYLRV